MPMSVCNVQRATATLHSTSQVRPLFDVTLDLVGPLGERTSLVIRVDPRHNAWAERFVRAVNLANLEPSALPVDAAAAE